MGSMIGFRHNSVIKSGPMMLRTEVVAALGEVCRSNFLERVCALIRSEFAEFRLLPEEELSGFAENLMGRAEIAGILEERAVARFILLACSWSALSGTADHPAWFGPILHDQSLDGATKVTRLHDRSRIESLVYGHTTQN